MVYPDPGFLLHLFVLYYLIRDPIKASLYTGSVAAGLKTTDTAIVTPVLKKQGLD